MVDSYVKYILLSAWICLAISAGCSGQPSTDDGNHHSADGPSTGKLVFRDDFDDGSLGPQWVEGVGEDGAGSWRITDGQVEGVDIHNDPLWLKQQLPEHVRIEFDITGLSPVGDLKVEVFGDGLHHESGYILIFGGWTNSLDVIARLDEHGKDRKSRKTDGVMPGYTYHMAIERVGSTLHWYVDGKPFMTYDDAQPLVGKKHRYFAFNIWSAPVRYDNVEVYDLSK